MDEETKKRIEGLFAEAIRQKDNQGYAVRVHQRDSASQFLNELNYLENGNPDLKEELLLVSKFIS